mmetsp:Transcript_15368/g.33303  ORF Transcript_15368/g.33303 Transcript_15368/m.33303 type:complete len:904 (+) Transcript_15368:136-2847(+)|eukprot:CAMPEP_0202916446 /NCGR_PEP_ID=MMETSP1392-20130828/68586_1 /ASSEMBLY_ACC=CAM_ASM_000868 /TAXON_ID=225041 /ORGANISM="Chlamydomonas chlamydogama, Strain SAG 11-48b" /LENGTH=903 /DNA_ID=CAMNT_0049608875 /DNA_START=103 /DNA_END=2814 /DNA_ORIENTATION=-
MASADSRAEQEYNYYVAKAEFTKAYAAALKNGKSPDIGPKGGAKDSLARVLPNVFLAGQELESDLCNLRNNGITHVLQVGAELSPSHQGHLVYKCLPLYDLEEQDLITHLPECFNFIDAARQHGAVLVHCMAGVSRSASVVIAYLMWSGKMTFSEARAAVKTTRHFINPNLGFILQLQLFESCGYSWSSWQPWNLSRFLEVKGEMSRRGESFDDGSVQGACPASSPELVDLDSDSNPPSPRPGSASAVKAAPDLPPVETPPAPAAVLGASAQTLTALPGFPVRPSVETRSRLSGRKSPLGSTSVMALGMALGQQPTHQRRPASVSGTPADSTFHAAAPLRQGYATIPPLPPPINPSSTLPVPAAPGQAPPGRASMPGTEALMLQQQQQLRRAEAVLSSAELRPASPRSPPASAHGSRAGRRSTLLSPLHDDRSPALLPCSPPSSPGGPAVARMTAGLGDCAPAQAASAVPRAQSVTSMDPNHLASTSVVPPIKSFPGASRPQPLRRAYMLQYAMALQQAASGQPVPQNSGADTDAMQMDEGGQYGPFTPLAATDASGQLQLSPLPSPSLPLQHAEGTTAAASGGPGHTGLPPASPQSSLPHFLPMQASPPAHHHHQPVTLNRPPSIQVEAGHTGGAPPDCSTPLYSPSSTVCTAGTALWSSPREGAHMDWSSTQPSQGGSESKQAGSEVAGSSHSRPSTARSSLSMMSVASCSTGVRASGMSTSGGLSPLPSPESAGGAVAGPGALRRHNGLGDWQGGGSRPGSGRSGSSSISSGFSDVSRMSSFSISSGGSSMSGVSVSGRRGYHRSSSSLQADSTGGAAAGQHTVPVIPLVLPRITSGRPLTRVSSARGNFLGSGPAADKLPPLNLAVAVVTEHLLSPGMVRSPSSVRSQSPELEVEDSWV